MNFWRFDADSAVLGHPLVGSYDPLLVGLSFVISCFAGITALALADRMTASPSRSAKAWWQLGGAAALGGTRGTGTAATEVTTTEHAAGPAKMYCLNIVAAEKVGKQSFGEQIGHVKENAVQLQTMAGEQCLQTTIRLGHQLARGASCEHVEHLRGERHGRLVHDCQRLLLHGFGRQVWYQLSLRVTMP